MMIPPSPHILAYDRIQRIAAVMPMTKTLADGTTLAVQVGLCPEGLMFAGGANYPTGFRQAMEVVLWKNLVLDGHETILLDAAASVLAALETQPAEAPDAGH